MLLVRVQHSCGQLCQPLYHQLQWTTPVSVLIFNAESTNEVIWERNTENQAQQVNKSDSQFKTHHISCLKRIGTKSQWSLKSETEKAKFLAAGDACKAIFWPITSLDERILDNAFLRLVSLQIFLYDWFCLLALYRLQNCLLYNATGRPTVPGYCTMVLVDLQFLVTVQWL